MGAGMNTRVGLLVGLTAALLAGGCGTVANTLGNELNPPFRETTPKPENNDTSKSIDSLGTLGPLWSVSEEHQKRVYGGIMADVEILWAARDHTPHHDIDPLWALADFPLSALGDTFTLPYILAYQFGLIEDGSKAKKESYPPSTPETEPQK
jgi:uncharacterized protein YceK